MFIGPLRGRMRVMKHDYKWWVGETSVGGVPELTGPMCLRGGFAQSPP